ncbi:MAG: PQQ-dependent sugar dehydrogenase [Sphingobium sp.]|nr:PQQ-dependent sugar dehydrogenase [Sphingobium sp.]
MNSRPLGLVAIAMLMACTSQPATSQVNAGDLAPTADQPFTLTKVTTLNFPWRIAFLPDGRMLVTEKPGKVQLVTQSGEKTEVSGVPAVEYQGQGGLLGIYAAPTFAKDRGVYLTYSEPGDGGSSLALAHATLNGAKLDGLKVIWRDMPKGKGGQFGAALAFSPDKKYLFLTVGDRMRFTPAQDPNTQIGKILRLTLDGKPAPGNPMAGKVGSKTLPLIDPPRDTEAAKTAQPVSTYTLPGPNLAQAETWSTGHRTPYGLAFAPDGRLWEVEHGPRGGDELNLIEPGKNYGWPLVSYSQNYNGVPIPSPDTRPDLTKPVIYWTPVIAPGSLMFYTGKLFPQWTGSAFIGGMGSNSLNRIVVNGSGAKPAERWKLPFRVRDVAQGPDGALWLLDDAPGALYKMTPK